MIPFGKRILIQKIKDRTGEMIDGVFMPGSIKGDGKKRGLVIDVNRENNFIKANDIVVYEGDGKNIISDDGKEFFIINEDQILTVE